MLASLSPNRRAALAAWWSPDADRFRRIALVALVLLTAIVATGAAVRLTGSGLGCPDWPKCYGHTVAPLKTHALIEYGNRLISGLVGIVTLATALLAWRRRPFRRDLALLALLLPLGVLAQAVLGGFTVRHRLAPGYVMAHFGLSMILLIAAVALAWRATHEPGSRPRARDRRAVWTVRALLPLGAVTIFAGTVATAAGPNAGGFGAQRIHRLTFKGADTLSWTIHQHAAIAALFGVCALATWFALGRWGADAKLRDAVSALVLLLAAQGLVGSVQYELHLPGEMVWIHVTLATLSWLALLWSAAAAGRLAPRAVSVAAPAGHARATQERAARHRPHAPTGEGVAAP